MSMEKFQSLVRKDEGSDLFRSLRELARLETGEVRDLPWGPWS